jgi:hypothetical protein
MYRARLEHVGKSMVCQGCKKKFRIPAGAAKVERGASESHRPVERNRTRPAEPPAPKSPPQQVRMPPPPRPEPDEFMPQPDVFDDGDVGYEVVQDDLPLPEPAAEVPAWTAPQVNDSALQTNPVKKKKKRKNQLQFLEDIVDSPKLLFLFGGVLAVILIVAGIMFAPLALAMRLIGALFTGGGFIYALRMAFDESASCGLFYLFDCSQLYRLYYTVTRWSDMKHAFFAEMFGLLLFIPWVVLTTEDFVDETPVNLNDFNGFEVEEMDDPEPPGQFQFPDGDVRLRAPTDWNDPVPLAACSPVSQSIAGMHRNLPPIVSRGNARESNRAMEARSGGRGRQS